MSERIDILQRVLNLRELADSSSSESEAMNAMKIADRLMHSYRIEEAELALAEGLGEIKVEIANEKRFGLGLKVGRVRHKVQSVIWALERYCEIEIVLTHRRLSYRVEEDGIHAIGDRPDVELFWYLLDLVRDAMDREYLNWRRGQQGVGRGAKASFQLAMGSRIIERLNALRREREAEREEAIKEGAKLLNKSADDVRSLVGSGDLRQLTSTALVIVGAAQQKREAVDREFNRVYGHVKLGSASGFGYRSNSSASAAGRAAGNNVNFGRPVSGGSCGLLK